MDGHGALPLCTFGPMAAAPEHLYGGELLAMISTKMVKLQKEFAGKGPTKARTYWAGTDTLLTVMGGGYTAAEQTLYAGGERNTVRNARRAFQDVMEERMRALIEGATGRKVLAFLSASHQEPDLVAELFVLEPQEEQDSPVRAEDQREAPGRP